MCPTREHSRLRGICCYQYLLYERKDCKLLKSKLKDMNKEVRAQKKVVYYCYDIEESQRDMKRKANMVLSDMAVENQSERDAQMDLDN